MAFVREQGEGGVEWGKGDVCVGGVGERREGGCLREVAWGRRWSGLSADKFV